MDALEETFALAAQVDADGNREAAARLELARLRDCELMLRLVHKLGSGANIGWDGDAWYLDDGYAHNVQVRMPDDGTGLPLLDAAARERIGKELGR